MCGRSWGDLDGVGVRLGFFAAARIAIEIAAEDNPPSVGREREVRLDASVFAVVMTSHVDEAFSLKRADVDEIFFVAVRASAHHRGAEKVNPLAVAWWVEEFTIAGASGDAAWAAAVAGEQLAIAGDVVVYGPFLAREMVPCTVASREIDAG